VIAFTVLVFIATLLVFRQLKTSRTTMMFGAVFMLPLIALEFWLTGTLNRLGVTTLQQILEILNVTLGMMSVGALSVLAAHWAANHWWKLVAHPARYRLWWCTLGIGISVILFALGQPAPVALMIGLAFNALLVVTIERDLIWDVAVSSVAFAAAFILLDIVIGIRASGDIGRLLIGQTSLGLTFAGLPLERLLTVGLLGGLIGPLFSATKFRRSESITYQEAVPHVKIFIVALLGIFGAGSLAWVTPIYILPPSVQSSTPASNATDVATTSTITLTFSRPIDRQTLGLAITPAVEGSWTFTEPQSGDHGYRQATYTLDTPLPNGTAIQVRVTGIRSIWRQLADDYAFQFTTVAAPVVVPVVEPAPVVETPPIVIPPQEPVPVNPVPPVETPAPALTPAPATPAQKILSIKLDYQDQALSCEAAALKMALAGRGVNVTEGQIMKLVGYDPTPHRGDVWGDPNVAFVGNIAGHQNTTGYGVHWDPIAKAANNWRTARVITNGTIQQLAAEIYAGHPVVIWGTLGTAYRDDWKTPSGKTVKAWKGEHARTLIGVIGTADKPTSFVINDPIVGRVTWSAAKFDANWKSFDRSAVVVE